MKLEYDSVAGVYYISHIIKRCKATLGNIQQDKVVDQRPNFIYP